MDPKRSVPENDLEHLIRGTNPNRQDEYHDKTPPDDHIEVNRFSANDWGV